MLYLNTLNVLECRKKLPLIVNAQTDTLRRVCCPERFRYARTMQYLCPTTTVTGNYEWKKEKEHTNKKKKRKRNIARKLNTMSGDITLMGNEKNLYLLFDNTTGCN